jgi:ubiquinone/menaquinone biosynthesis C-methylase UbiE
MNPSEYQTMFNVEDRHWWYKGMQHITTTLVAQMFPQRRDLHILDAGCGTGAAMSYLAPFGTVAGCDLSPLALGFCQQRGLSRLGQASVTQLPYADSQFDLVTSFDVLYHQSVSEYQLALAEFGRVLKENGRLLLRLPAYNWLRGHHDEVIHTKHRFTAKELRQALSTRQFEIEKLSYANTLLFPLAVAKRLAETVIPANGEQSDITANPEWQDKLFVRFLEAEANWLRHRSLPFGLTVIAIGRKRG